MCWHKKGECPRAELRAENARLQERVEEAEQQVRMAAPSAVAWKEKADRLARDIKLVRADRDRFEALAERRKKALVKMRAVVTQRTADIDYDIERHTEREWLDRLFRMFARAAIEEKP